MSALPAFSAEARSSGSARALSAWVCGPSPVSAMVLTPISFPCWTVACTWMTENGVTDRRADRGARARRAASAPPGAAA